MAQSVGCRSVWGLYSSRGWFHSGRGPRGGAAIRSRAFKRVEIGLYRRVQRGCPVDLCGARPGSLVDRRHTGTGLNAGGLGERSGNDSVKRDCVAPNSGYNGRDKLPCSAAGLGELC